MSFVWFAWGSSIVYAIGAIIGKIATRHHIANPWLYNFIWWLGTAICIIPFALANGVGLPQDWGSILWLSLANIVSGTLFVLAFYAIDITVLAPLGNLRTPLAALTGVVLLGETLGAVQWALIGIIFVGGLLINLDERMSLGSVINKKIGLGLVWVVSSVWFNASIKYASAHNGFWEVSLWSNVIALLLSMATLPWFSQDLLRTPMRKYGGVIVSTVLFTVGLLLSVRALSENVSISLAIISLPITMPITIALSRFAPQLLEKHTAKVYAIRVASAAVMVAAALGLSK